MSDRLDVAPENMNATELLVTACNELRMQQLLIQKFQSFHDNTGYRAWVNKLLPSLIAILEYATADEVNGWEANDRVLALARAVLELPSV